MKTDPRLIDIFLDVAKIEGLSGNEKATGDYIKEFLGNLGITVFEDDVHKVSGGNCGNLIARVGDGGDFALLSHLDTARSTGNLKPLVREDRICSDGTTILGADNRAGVAVILYTVERAVRENLNVKNFTAAFTICEETTLAGSRNIKLGKQIKMGFVFDSAFRPSKFICQSFGAQSFKIKVCGKAAHAGIAPEKGVNSIAAAAKGISLLTLGRIDKNTTANIGVIAGGTAVNVVPEETVLEGEVRSLDSQKVVSTVADIQNRFQSAVSEYGAQLQFDFCWDFKPYHLTEDMPVYRQIWEAINRTGLKPEPTISAGGSDANSLNANGLPAVNIGIGAQNPHANDEFILKEDLQKSADIAWALIEV